MVTSSADPNDSGDLFLTLLGLLEGPQSEVLQAPLVHHSSGRHRDRGQFWQMNAESPDSRPLRSDHFRQCSPRVLRARLKLTLPSDSERIDELQSQLGQK
jgi:hypothetical protein